MAVKAVVFDVGETLVDETRAWSFLADRAGVPRLTFFAVLGSVIAAPHDHSNVFDRLGIPVPDGGWPGYEPEDLYPDALPCLESLKAQGYALGIAGNQPRACEDFIRSACCEVDLVASSAGWGVSKPSPEFFSRIADSLALEPEWIAYVGDRVDNDVVPAKEAGMVAIFIRRGPWGFLHADWAEVECADASIDSLAELPDVLGRV